MKIQNLTTECVDFLRFVLTTTICDEDIPEDQIGEGKKYQWRRGHKNHKPFLVNQETGEIVESTLKGEKKPKPYHSAFFDRISQPCSKKYKSATEAQKALNKQGMKLKGFEKLKQYDWKHVSKLFDSLRIAHYDFPDLRINMEYTEVEPADNAFMSIAPCYVPDKLAKKIKINSAQEFHCRKDLLENDMQPSKKRGWSAPNQTTASTFYHEVWHAMLGEMVKSCYSDLIYDWYKGYNNDKQFDLDVYTAMEGMSIQLCDAICEEAFKTSSNTKTFAQRQAVISKYATVNSDETIAEAFSDVFANGTKANVYSKKIYDTVKKYSRMNKEQIIKKMEGEK